jgi:anti-sigma factor RsiW
MEHTKDIHLIEFVAKRLDPDREKAVRRHLENCSACRDKLADLQGTWDALGAWEVSLAAHRGLERAVSAEPQADTAGSYRVLRFPRWATIVRVAAAIVVAAVVGYVGGRGSVGEVVAAEQPGTPEYISALSLEVGESFSSLVFEDEASAGEGDAV